MYMDYNIYGASWWLRAGVDADCWLLVVHGSCGLQWMSFRLGVKDSHAWTEQNMHFLDLFGFPRIIETDQSHTGRQFWISMSIHFHPNTWDEGTEPPLKLAQPDKMGCSPTVHLLFTWGWCVKTRGFRGEESCHLVFPLDLQRRSGS